MILFVTRRFSGLSKDIVHLTNTNAAVSTVNVQYVCLCVCLRVPRWVTCGDNGSTDWFTSQCCAHC